MKSIIKIQLFLLVLTNLFSCNNANEKVDTNNNNIVKKREATTLAKSEPLNMDGRYILFTYSDNSEIERKLPAAIVAVSNAMNSEITSTEGLAHISSRIELINGQGVLSEYKFLDSRDKILSWYKFDTTTRAYVNVPFSGEPVEPTINCPAGFSYLGVCAYTKSLGSCAAVKSIGYAMSAIENNKTPTIAIVNGVDNVKICGKNF